MGDENPPRLLYPRILFLGDGVIATIVHSKSTRDSPPKKEFLLKLPGWAKRQAGIEEKDLIFDYPNPLAVGGVYRMTYDADLILQINDNPEFPLFVAFCNIYGDKLMEKDKYTGIIKNLVDEIESLRKRIDAKDDLIEELENQLKEKYKVHKRFERFIPEREEKKPDIHPIEVIGKGSDNELKKD